jgi:hypothetical protein
MTKRSSAASTSVMLLTRADYGAVLELHLYEAACHQGSEAVLSQALGSFLLAGLLRRRSRGESSSGFTREPGFSKLDGEGSALVRLGQVFGHSYLAIGGL